MIRTLYIDMGNSCLKWAISSGGDLGGMSRMSYTRESIAEVLSAAWGGEHAPQRIYAASVAAPEVSNSLAHWTQTHWDLAINFVKASAEDCGVKNAYEIPETLGVDRWLGLIAAGILLRGPVCVIDCGTAITIDVLDARGNHLGGQISPGIAAMEKALINNAAALAAVEVPVDEQLLARDTAAAVKAGCLWSAVAYVDRLVAEIKERLKQPVQVVLTGGDAPLLLPYVNNAGSWHHEPDWVLQGLQILAGDR